MTTQVIPPGTLVAIEPIAVDKDTACTVLGGISPATLMRLVDDGDLCARKLGSRTVFAVEDLKRFVSQLPAWEPQK